jgi:LuxR family transcriptional regulator, maltose regulon positive regulatory protein
MARDHPITGGAKGAREVSMTIQATLGARQVVTRAKAPAASARDPVLASRITVPGVPKWAVPRPRIAKMITEGVRWCPLTVVTGPPGAGKTMALALWTAAEPGTVAWVSLDKYNNGPGLFWSYVVAALRRSGVTVPKGLPGAARSQAGDLGFLLRLAAVLAAQDPPVTLVLDDLHLVTDPTVADGLDFMLRNVGPGLRLVICSRTDPPLRLHRYRSAGQLAEIRSSDLAFTTAEADLLLARHGITLTADLLECLTRRTEGWAVGLRLAALSLVSHPDPGQFVNELIAEDSAVAGYLMDEVLDRQPPQVRDVLLCTSILDQVSVDAVAELAGDEQARGIFSDAARTNAFIQPIGSGRYRYHKMFSEVLRLTLRREGPDRVATLHRRAARWHERSGLLTDAVRHAARAGDWELASDLVIEDLAIGQILEPQGSEPLAAEFAGMPPGQAWSGPQPHLVVAAVALSAGQPESYAAALAAAEGVLERVPADQQAACGLAAALIRLAASLRSGDVAAAAAAAVQAEALLGQVPEHKLDRHAEIRARVLSGRGAVELWSGHLDEAARFLRAAMAAQPGSAGNDRPADYLGYLALTEALRGRLRYAEQLAARATGSPRPPIQNLDPAALVALAWVHLERNDLREAGSWLKQADAALSANPAKLIAAVAYLVAACGALAEGRAAVVTQIVTRARSGCYVPGWLDHKLSLVQSRACAAAGDLPAAIAAAGRAGADTSPEVAVTLAHAWMTAGDGDKARRALAPALAADGGAPDQVRVQAWLVDARLGYTSGDRVRGRRSLASALQLAEPEQLRLPVAMERSWIGPVLRNDSDLASSHRCLLAPALPRGQLPAPPAAPDQAAILMVEPLSEREREVLQHVSGMLSTTEVASEMHISIHTVKTHVRSILRKLAVTHRGEAVRRARQLGLI